MWRPEDWDATKIAKEAGKDYFFQPFSGVCEAGLKSIVEASADAMQKAIIAWIKTHELVEHNPLEGDPFDAYLVPVREIPSVDIVRKCQYCDKEELCGVGEANVPVCVDHYNEYLKCKRQEIDDVYQGIDKFHAHLDICEQCRNHCFDLCPVGATLLQEAATGGATSRH